MIDITTETQPDPKGKPVPKLMINNSNGKIIHQSTHGSTVLVDPVTPADQGKFYPSLSIADYVDYVGVLTLENAE